MNVTVIPRSLDEIQARLKKKSRPSWRWGILARKESLWVGMHYSEYNKRWCINLVPCVTFWIVAPGGNVP